MVAKAKPKTKSKGASAKGMPAAGGGKAPKPVSRPAGRTKTGGGKAAGGKRGC